MGTASQKNFPKIKVLAVDNSPVLLRAVTTILKQEGCDVFEAETGLDALEILDSCVPDILLTDLIMPRVSGEQLCRVVRSSKKYQNVFIVVLSAIVLEDKERILEEVDCDLCIAKGNLKELRQHLQFALKSFESRGKGEDSVPATTQIPKGLKPLEVAGELLLEKQHNLAVLSNLKEGILELTQDGRIVAVNKSACDILCIPEEKLTGAKLEEIGCWGDFKLAIGRWVEEELQGEGMMSFHIYEDFPLFIEDRVVTASFIAVDENDSIFGLCTLRDITRQHTAEQQNKQLDDAIKLAKKMDAMSCMAGGMAHDFNNLLTVICGNLDIISLNKENEPSGPVVKLIEQAQKAALIAVDLTRQISCFSNFGIVSRKEKDLTATVKESVENYFEVTSGEYTIESSDKEIFVSMDAEEISSAIKNVLQNAQEASGLHEVKVTISPITLTSPQILSGQYIPAGNYGCVAIVDSGPGIEKDDLFRVFDPYYSTKERGIEKGMGLGLTIVYATLRNHGGYVVVDSEKSEGTRVSLYLPVIIAQSKSQIEMQKKERDSSVLLVDPDPQMREIGSIMLRHLGFEVFSVANSSEASLELQRIQSENSTKPTIVILDVSGINKESPADCCKIFRKIDPTIQVIAMSGTILDPMMEKSSEYGFANSLSKPYTMDGLRHVVNSVLYN